MTNKLRSAKRKSEGNWSAAKDDRVPQEAEEIEEENELLNVVNGDEEDSSDSEGDVSSEDDDTVFGLMDSGDEQEGEAEDSEAEIFSEDEDDDNFLGGWNSGDEREEEDVVSLESDELFSEDEDDDNFLRESGEDEEEEEGGNEWVSESEDADDSDDASDKESSGGDEEEVDNDEESSSDKKLTNQKKKIPNGKAAAPASPFKTHTRRAATSDESRRDDEYREDSSDEEDIRNTVGNVPMNWYDNYKHLGYDWDGKRIIKPAQGDQIDEFLKRMEDPDFWRTVKDPQTGQDVVLSEQDINLIKRIQGQKIPDETFDEYAPWINWFTSEVMQMPLRKFPEHKRSFLPSKSEAKKVSKLVHALKMGWLKTKAEQDRERARKDPQFYMLWQTDDQVEEMRRIHKHISAPKRHLPGHAESYNPPPEYLFDAKELKQWNKQKNSPWKRKLHFVPQKFDSLRKVPSYSRYIKERFLRCLDLYLCPRAIKMRLTIEPEALVPKLPSPRDLQPFPTVHSIVYEGHSDMVRCMSTDKFGQYLVSGSDDCSIKIWEVNTGRCIKTIAVEGIVRSVEWCPNSAISLILVAANNRVILINPNVGDFVVSEKTDEVLKEAPKSEVIVPERVRATIQWEEPTEQEYERGFRLILKHFKEVSQVTWHGKGDYFATVMPEGANRSVLIHQLSRRRSQLPFTKAKGLVQCVLFHPTRPLLFVATQRHVRIYDLVKQMLVKKLMTNSKWISKMAVHSGGDNLLVGTYDRKILWFDLDLSTKPYQTLRLHGTAVRGIAFHKRYPLFASGSDDRSLIISHGMVYNDLLKNPLIVPLKRLQDHEARNDFGIFDVKFHPIQPWVFSTGADGTIRLYCN